MDLTWRTMLPEAATGSRASAFKRFHVTQSPVSLCIQGLSDFAQTPTIQHRI